ARADGKDFVLEDCGESTSVLRHACNYAAVDDDADPKPARPSLMDPSPCSNGPPGNSSARGPSSGSQQTGGGVRWLIIYMIHLRTFIEGANDVQEDPQSKAITKHGLLEFIDQDVQRAFRQDASKAAVSVSVKQSPHSSASRHDVIFLARAKLYQRSEGSGDDRSITGFLDHEDMSPACRARHSNQSVGASRLEPGLLRCWGCESASGGAGAAHVHAPEGSWPGPRARWIRPDLRVLLAGSASFRFPVSAARTALRGIGSTVCLGFFAEEPGPSSGFGSLGILGFISFPLSQRRMTSLPSFLGQFSFGRSSRRLRLLFSELHQMKMQPSVLADLTTLTGRARQESWSMSAASMVAPGTVELVGREVLLFPEDDDAPPRPPGSPPPVAGPQYPVVAVRRSLRRWLRARRASAEGPVARCGHVTGGAGGKPICPGGAALVPESPAGGYVKQYHGLQAGKPDLHTQVRPKPLDGSPASEPSLSSSPRVCLEHTRGRVPGSTCEQRACGKCAEAIAAPSEACTRLAKVFHSACFTCHCCGARADWRDLLRRSIALAKARLQRVLRPGLPDYTGFQQSSEACSACGHLITDQILQALGRPFHPACFRCSVCQRCLDGRPFTVDVSGSVFLRVRLPQGVRAPLPTSAPSPLRRRQRRSRRGAQDCQHADCGMQLSNESHRRCYPLVDKALNTVQLFCYTCRIRRND
uniref:LIM zinc-binding domain-containing protein n=1 Tax=Macrostomum lignano TaxID=282301 RepID=A0A1I8F1B5_9PLAT